MNLLLTVCLACTLLYGAEAMRCRVCSNTDCSNTTSQLCPGSSPICKTETVVTRSGVTTVIVNKSCSTQPACDTPLDRETEWSVNRGFAKEAHNQICCITDDCNFPTLAIPNPLRNGKVCAACVNLTGNCDSTLDCEGVEDTCFNGTATVSSVERMQKGCMSRNICMKQTVLESVLGKNAQITCGAPWSISISALLLIAAVTAHKILV